MHSSPVVTIITSTFEGSRFVDAYVSAIQAQTFRDWECLIVDDGSSDGTARALEERVAGDTRFQIIVRPHSGRPAPNRELALRRARGQYVAFCDQDDFWYPSKLEAQLRAFALHPEATLCHTERRYAHAAGGLAPPAGLPISDDQIVLDQLERALLERCAVTCSTVMAPRERLLAVGGFHPDLSGVDDYHLWLKLCALGPLLLIRAPLVLCAIHDRNMSSPAAAHAAGLMRMAEALVQEGAPPAVRHAARAHALKACAVAAWVERPLHASVLLLRSGLARPSRRAGYLLFVALLSTLITGKQRQKLWVTLQARRRARLVRRPGPARSDGLSARACDEPPRVRDVRS